jgi:hypothetical protein
MSENTMFVRYIMLQLLYAYDVRYMYFNAIFHYKRVVHFQLALPKRVYTAQCGCFQ